MRDTLTFILNGVPQSVTGTDPSTTLLNHLRKTLRLTGSKEGCAEGDCGACTVVLGELLDSGVRYRAVNACILLLPMLEGKSVITVEALRQPDGSLHPAQRAMVEQHGSQCGFCTPGIVMSLFAMYLNEPRPTPARANDVLAGNLCRCTGYGPIVTAAQAMYDLPAVPRPDERAALEAIAHEETFAFSHAGAQYFLPATLDELCGLAEVHPDAVIVSGATDVGLWITKQHRRIVTFIGTGRVSGLRAITRTDDALRIGAGCTWGDLEELLGELYPDLGELLRRFASVQVRNTATIGGNIANGSPIGDGPPALIALGAQLVLRKGGTTRTLPLEDYFLAYGQQNRAPGEIVEGVDVPIAADSRRFRAYKISKRFDQDISAVCGCFNIAVADGMVTQARIAFGGMAATPKRATHVETRLTGRPWTEATIEAALSCFEQDFAPITDMRSSAAYRMLTAKNLLRRYYLETQSQPPPTRLVGPDAAFA